MNSGEMDGQGELAKNDYSSRDLNSRVDHGRKKNLLRTPRGTLSRFL
jgi:hypothetical protein